ncbi:uncharacterized protein bcorl1 isoform 2-T4 [Menidia menidia]
MQVDSTLMNVGDGGTVSREISAPTKASTSMVGNPPQTLPAEFRGDVDLSQQNKTTPTRDYKAVKACLDSTNCNHSPELSPPQQPNNAPMSGSVLTSTEKRSDKRADVPKVRADGAGVFPTAQWSGGVKAGRDDPLSPCHGSVTSSKKSHPQTQPLQSIAPGFQCSTMFKPAQPVAFLPSTNFSPSLCKINLPPALSQIAALRESHFQKDAQPQSSGAGDPPLMRTYPYSLSVGRTSDKKGGGSALKLKSNHASGKNSKSLGEHKSLTSVVASPALQHPSLTSAAPAHYTLSPTAAICCSSTLASITSQSKLLNHVEKGNGIDKTAMCSLNAAPPPGAEHRTPCSPETRDVPLDLSAKSKRPKCTSEAPVSGKEPHDDESNQRDFLNAKRTHSTAYSSAMQYPILPNTHRNGSHQKQLNKSQNHQVPEPKPTWGKGPSQESLKTIPGTYVGVASPILASTLRSKDGKATFADEFQSFAKQEFISIVDQGEHLSSGGKKPSCLMKGSQQAPPAKHVKNPSTAPTKNCPPKGALTTALLSSAGPPAHPKSGAGKPALPYPTAVLSQTWQPPAHPPHQSPPAQRKIAPGYPKTKAAAVTEGCKFQSPFKTEEDKWERMKSPLSNLASIVKQQALETALTAEGNSPASPGASRKADALNSLSGGQDSQSKHASHFEYPPYWSVNKFPGASAQEEPTQTTKRHDKTNATEPSENDGAVHARHEQCTAQHTKQASSKAAGQSHLFGSSASTNGSRSESKLAQVLEGGASREEDGPSETPPSKKEGAVASIARGQCERRGSKLEKKANGTKEESPTKGKAAAKKQKKATPKKAAKEKSPAEPVKKAPGRKRRDTENSPAKASPNKKKKRCAPVLEQSLSPQRKEPIPKDKNSPNRAEQPARHRADSRSRPDSREPSACVGREADAAESSFPRLRRGRRRADDARLDLWGFATPSPPPPPMPPPPASPPLSPSQTPAQPARRPRGRPRSNTQPERTLQGKAKIASTERDAAPHKKRRRCTSKKYETGDYITEKDKLEDGGHLEGSLRQETVITAGKKSSSPPITSQWERGTLSKVNTAEKAGIFLPFLNLGLTKKIDEVYWPVNLSV